MARIRVPHLVVLLSLTSFCCELGATVILETSEFRLEIGDDACVRSLRSKPEGAEYLANGSRSPLAMVYRGGRAVPLAKGTYAAVTGRWAYHGGSRHGATSVARDNDKLLIDFGTANVRAVYRVRENREYLGFQLVDMEGEEIDRIDLLRLNVRRLPSVGEWVNAVYDDQFGICLWAGNLETNAELWPKQDAVLMTSTAEAEVGLIGATAVLFACRTPEERFLERMAAVENDFHLPTGAANRRSRSQKLSYLWAARPTLENIDEYIRWAQEGGFRALLLSYASFSKGAGHFEWNDSYPNGMADLKQVTDRVREAGLKLGLHIHYSKARKNDRYVTPIPDDRLHESRVFTLAAGVAADAKTLPVRENPSGCTLDEGRRLIRLGQELVEYETYPTQPPFQFTGCRRGHLGTEASAHAEGDSAGLLDVDTWPIFIRFDQTTDIQDEVARRIAEIYSQTGPYEMVYFDGAEDVHEPFWYNVASAQYRVYRLLEPRPPVCEAAHYTHFSWHMITRGNAYDIVAPPDGMKDFCRLMPCPTAAMRAKDFSRIQFGWLGHLGRTRLGYAGPDVFEYVASRAAAWDCPISLKAGLDDFRSNPRAADCLAAMKIWEDARIGTQLSEADRDLLKNVTPEDARYVPCYLQRSTFERLGSKGNLTPSQRRILADRREHHLFLNERGRHEIVEAEEVTGVAGGAVKGFLFRRESEPNDVYALAWAVDAPVRLRLRTAADQLQMMRPFGRQQAFESEGGLSRTLIDGRTYLVLKGMNKEEAVRVLRDAEVVQ